MARVFSEVMKMLYKVCKIIMADMEKEEEWLNEMAEKGFNFMDNFLMRYTFIEGTPNEYIYRIELLENRPNHPLSRQYIKFLQETGVECVSTSGRWAFFRKKTVDGPFDLYSDIDEKIRHYKRNLLYTATILFMNIIVLSLNIVIAIVKHLPSNISIAISALVFTSLLSRTLVHYLQKIKSLKEEQQIHE